MKYSTTLLPLVATASAIVIPDEATAKQLILDVKQQTEETVSTWWDALPSFDDALSSAHNVLDDAIRIAENKAGELSEDTSLITDFLSTSDYNNGPHHGPPGHSTNLTVYQSIHASNYTKRFAALIDDFPDLVDKLNSTSGGNVTVLVPTDRAFERIPDHHKGHKPPKEFIEKLIQYHVLPGFYPAGRVLTHHTLPTAYEEEALGGRPQRLRVSVGLSGVRMNFFGKIIYANLVTKNGVVHGLDHILVPPPPIETLISLFPTKFSTLSLAAGKTGFGHHHNSSGKKYLTGITLFAPTNLAFKKLGPGANAFLFNTEKGLHYLKALLAYHVVVNETLYSDEYYGKKGSDSLLNMRCDEIESADDVNDKDQTTGKGVKHFHIDLPTLLGDKHIAVDITRWYGFIRIKLNGHVPVTIQDGVAKDGVIQVVDSVLIPPHKHKGSWNADVDGDIPVEELIERLSPFVADEEVGEL